MRPGDPGFEDLTARARIRYVALAHFAERGAKATTIRGVAQDAGVSASLVQHHFGTKDGLRDACDAYVVERLRRDVKRGVTDHGLGDPDFVATAYETAPLVMRYLVRALTDGSPTGATLFDEMVALTEEYLANRAQHRPSARAVSTRDHAAVFTAMKLGVTVLHQHLSRALNVDALAPAGLTRIGAAMLDIVAPAFAGPELIGLARTGIDQFVTAMEEQGNERRDPCPEAGEDP